MLVVFFGNDTIKVRERAFSEIEEYKKQGFVIESLPLNEFEAGILADAAGGSSLFGQSTLYLIDMPSADAAAYDVLVDSLPELASSEHVFVVIEGNLLAAEKKKFGKHTNTVEEYRSAAAKRFNTFAIADALSKKDKRNLWLLLTEAREEGIAEEEIIGILWWQLKALRLAAATPSAAAAGMKDWPYNKAKQSLRNFQDGEIEKLSNSLLKLYHDARAGRVDMDISLEKWILSI